MCKVEQLSDWNHRPLSTGQEQYASLDAFCLLGIVDVMDVFMHCFVSNVRENNSSSNSYYSASDKGNVAKFYLGEDYKTKIENAVAAAQKAQGKGGYWSMRLKQLSEAGTAGLNSGTAVDVGQGQGIARSNVDTLWSGFLF